MSTESAAVHTHRSHTFSGTVHYGEEPCSEYTLSLTQLCRRFTRVMVTRLFIKFHCEIYLTHFLESVLQSLINIRLMVMSLNTMKYLPDPYLLLSLFKQWHYHQQWPTLSTQGHITLSRIYSTPCPHQEKTPSDSWAASPVFWQLLSVPLAFTEYVPVNPPCDRTEETSCVSKASLFFLVWHRNIGSFLFQ